MSPPFYSFSSDYYPYVTITVYSDELGVTKDLDKAAVLTRTYYPEDAEDFPEGLNGWDLALYRYKTATKTCDNDFLCDAVDGRYYSVSLSLFFFPLFSYLFIIHVRRSSHLPPYLYLPLHIG